MRDDHWHIELRRFSGRKPWSAFICQGMMKLGEPGSGTYKSKHPEDALRKALKVVATRAPQTHPRRITIDISVQPEGPW